MLEIQPFDFSRWPIAVSDLPLDTYLVGGAVRDALLGRTTLYPDLDFIVPNQSLELAATLAQRYQAGFVVLDRQRQIGRVVFKNMTVDIAQQQGDTLLTDLRDRDFRLNAIAYDIHRHHIVDPLGGLLDLNDARFTTLARTTWRRIPCALCAPIAKPHSCSSPLLQTPAGSSKPWHRAFALLPQNGCVLNSVIC